MQPPPLQPKPGEGCSDLGPPVKGSCAGGDLGSQGSSFPGRAASSLEQPRGTGQAGQAESRVWTAGRAWWAAQGEGARVGLWAAAGRPVPGAQPPDPRKAPCPGPLLTLPLLAALADVLGHSGKYK